MLKSTLTARDMAPMIYPATQHIVFQIRATTMKRECQVIVFAEFFYRPLIILSDIEPE